MEESLAQLELMQKMEDIGVWSCGVPTRTFYRFSDVYRLRVAGVFRELGSRVVTGAKRLRQCERSSESTAGPFDV